MKKKRVFLGVAVVMLALSISSCSFGHYKWYKATPEERADYVVEKLTDELDLTEDQQKKLNVIKDEIVMTMRQHHQDRSGMHGLVVQQMRSDSIDKAALKTELKMRIEEADKHLDFMLDKLAEFHAILTPKQRKELADHMEKRAKWGGHHGHGMFGFGP